MEKNSIIIIGAGISGLSAGCYGQMNGYKTRIFEMHTKPGGVCTSWKRKGYVFDACIDWLVGTAPGKFYHSFWEELGAIQGKEIITHEEMQRSQDGKKALTIYSDIDRLETHMKTISPEDSPLIEELANAVRITSTVMHSSMQPIMEKPMEVMTLWEKIKILWTMRPLMKATKRYNKITIKQYANEFKDPFLRKALLNFMGGTPDDFAGSIPPTLALLNIHNAGHPIGGSLEFARGIEKRYLDLEGTIDYRSRVEKILVKDDKAVGVKLKDGSEHHADVVISAADGYSTIFEMLDGKYVDDKIKGYYKELTLQRTRIFVSIGVDLDLSGEPPIVVYHLDESISIAGEKREWIEVHNYSFDPTMAPSGKTMLNIRFRTGFDYWNNLLNDKEKYKAEKEKIANTVISELEKHLPGFKSKVEVTDVATPTTWVRYTGNWKGAHQGWAMTPKQWGMRIKKTLPGLKNFYLISQWVSPGGTLPVVAKLGRDVIQILCKKDKKKFSTNKP